MTDENFEKVLFVIGDEWHQYRWLNWQFDRYAPPKLEVRFITDEAKKDFLDKETLKEHLVNNKEGYNALLFDSSWGELVTVVKEIAPDMKCVLLDNLLNKGVYKTGVLKNGNSSYNFDVTLFDSVVSFGGDIVESISYLEKAVLEMPLQSKPKEI